MSHFVDQFRYKFDKEKQIILFSVSITEQRVIEHSIPVLAFWEMTNSYRANENYVSDVLKMKQLGASILFTIRENEFTRRSYKFNNSQFQRLIGKFRRNVDEQEIDQSIEFDPVRNSSHNLTQQLTENMNEILSSHTGDNTEVLLKINSLENLIGKLSKQISEMNETIKSLQETGIVQRVENKEQTIDDSMPMFIPSTVNTEFSGKVTTNTQQAEDDNVSSATQLLKKMKKKKGKKK